MIKLITFWSTLPESTKKSLSEIGESFADSGSLGSLLDVYSLIVQLAESESTTIADLVKKGELLKFVERKFMNKSAAQIGMEHRLAEKVCVHCGGSNYIRIPVAKAIE